MRDDDTPQRSGPDALTCDVSNLPCDAEVIEAMARLRLRAGRLGVDLRFVDPCEDLRAVVELTGLTDILLGSALEAERQAEEREEPSGVEEEGDP
jgi:anti-anti-sigma regulatory factor